MAIVRNPALSNEASGNLGGICYSRWRGLQVARGPWTGVVPNTSAQQVYQVYLTGVVQAWSGTLTDGERKGWNDLAKDVRWRDRLGSAYGPNGYQVFVRRNMNRQVCGLPISAVPVVINIDSQPTAIHVVYGVWGTQVRLQMKGWTGPLNAYCVQYWKAGPFDGGGRRAINPEYRLVRIQTDPSIDYRWFDTDVELGKWYWYRGRACWASGEVGNLFFCHGIVADGEDWPPLTYCRDNS